MYTGGKKKEAGNLKKRKNERKGWVGMIDDMVLIVIPNNNSVDLNMYREKVRREKVNGEQREKGGKQVV